MQMKQFKITVLTVSINMLSLFLVVQKMQRLHKRRYVPTIRTL